MKFKKIILSILMMHSFLSPNLFAKGEVESPLDMIKHTSDQVLEVLSTNKLLLEEQPEKIFGLVEATVIPRFDFQTMSRLVLGKHWKRASEDNRKAFIYQFKELLVRTYATALMSYSDQAIHYLPLGESKKKNRVVVKTEVKESGGSSIPIHYKMRMKEADWKVYDVVIDGISLVSNYRSGFNSQIRRITLVGLIDKLRERNEKNRLHDQ